jgi:hypothetical protein
MFCFLSFCIVLIWWITLSKIHFSCWLLPAEVDLHENKDIEHDPTVITFETEHDRAKRDISSEDDEFVPKRNVRLPKQAARKSSFSSRASSFDVLDDPSRESEEADTSAPAGQILGRRSATNVDDDDGEYCIFRKFFVSKLLRDGEEGGDAVASEALAAVGNPFLGLGKNISSSKY